MYASAHCPPAVVVVGPWASPTEPEVQVQLEGVAIWPRYGTGSLPLADSASEPGVRHRGDSGETPSRASQALALAALALALPVPGPVPVPVPLRLPVAVAAEPEPATTGPGSVEPQAEPQAEPVSASELELPSQLELEA